MTSLASASAAHSDSLTAVIVEPELGDIWFAANGLSESGFHVTVAEDFSEAKALIDRFPPDVLVTDVRLRDYNGLHLVLRGRSLRPTMAAVVVTSVDDPVTRADAERMGATYVLKPTSRKEFLAAVYRTLYRRPGDSNPIRPTFERRLGDRRGPAAVSSIDAERRLRERRRLPGRPGDAHANLASQL